MNRPNSSSFVGYLLVAALGASVAGPWLSSQSGSTSAPAIESATGAIATDRHGAMTSAADARTAVSRPLDEFLAVHLPAAPSDGLSEKTNDQTTNQRRSVIDPLSRLRIDFLVVTIADPVRSSVGHGFDQRLDAVQKAVTSQKYVLDRFYLPWPQDNPETTPGVILFRRKPEKKNESWQIPYEVLLVYLVGESPAFGIHKPAFDVAVDEILSIRRRLAKAQSQKGPNLDPIHVVGPSFSGSADSLAYTLDSVRERHMAESKTSVLFDVTLGSTTNLDSERFTRLSGYALAKKIRATTNPSWFRRKVLLDFIRERHVRRIWNRDINLVWLLESNTGYGIDPGESTGKPFQITRIPFPLHMSRLRTIASGPQRQLNGLSGLSRPVRLGVALDELLPATDVLPLQTAPQSMVREELALDAIVKHIRRHSPDYVLITATDEYDKLFLALTVYNYFPDVQILIEGSSRLFTHPEVLPYMRGALVTCTYPLHTTNQEWSFPWRGQHSDKASRRLAFSEGHVVSFYNATVLSLHYLLKEPAEKSKSPSALIDYGAPFTNLDSTPASSHAPPVWICAVGNTALIPLSWHAISQDERQRPGAERIPFPEPWPDVVDTGPRPSTRKPGHAARHDESFKAESNGDAGDSHAGSLELHWPPSSKVMLIALVTWVLTLSTLVGRYWSDPDFPDHHVPQTLRTVVRPRRDPESRNSQRRYLLCLVVLTWLQTTECATLMVVPMRVWMLGGHLDWWALTLLVLLTGSAILLATVGYRMGSTSWSGTSAKEEFTPRNVSWRQLVGIMTGAAVLQVIGICCLLFTFSGASDGPTTPMKTLGEAILLFERSLYWTSGVSLLTPSVLLWGAASVWLFSRLQRLSLKDLAKVDTPWPHPGTPRECSLGRSIEGMTATRKAIEAVVDTPCSQLRTAVGFSFLLVFINVAAWIAWIFEHSRPIPDGLLTTALLAAFLLLVAVWVHWLWEAGYLLIKLRKLMRQVAWTPLLAAVSRLPQRARTQLGSFLSPPPSSRRLSHLRIRVHYLTELARTFPQELRNARPWCSFSTTKLSDADRLLTAAIQEIDSPGNGTGASKTGEKPPRLKLLEHLNDAGKELFGSLVDAWSEAGIRQVYPQRDAVETQIEDSDQQRIWIQLAEEAVALQVLAYLQQYLRHLRSMLFGAMVVSLLLSLTLLSYPLQPVQTLLSTTNLMLVLTAGLGLFALLSFERDDFLQSTIGDDASRIPKHLRTGTSMLGYVIPPVLMLIRQFSPETLAWTTTLFEPLLRSPG
jgi:hypothetical protein